MASMCLPWSRPWMLVTAPSVQVLLTVVQTQSSPSISVGAVVIVPHSIHSWAKSYQPTALVSSSHITVTLNILHPQMQAKVGSPLRSFNFAVPTHRIVFNVKGKAFHMLNQCTSMCIQRHCCLVHHTEEVNIF